MCSCWCAQGPAKRCVIVAALTIVACKICFCQCSQHWPAPAGVVRRPGSLIRWLWLHCRLRQACCGIFRHCWSTAGRSQGCMAQCLASRVCSALCSSPNSQGWHAASPGRIYVKPWALATGTVVPSWCMMLPLCYQDSSLSCKCHVNSVNAMRGGCIYIMQVAPCRGECCARDTAPAGRWRAWQQCGRGTAGPMRIYAA